MKLKGDLDSVGLAELFKTLADQRATGVLTVSSPMGEKQLALSHGEIVVLSDKLAERSRIGDLLIARSRINDAQLSEALKEQRANPRIKLGDMMLKLGMITPIDITDSLRFQLEEEIYDLFTWKGGSFDFDGDRDIEEELQQENGTDKNVHRLSLDTQVLITEATRRIPEWEAIEARLPTPYLCFKLSPKGEELSATSPVAIQRLVRLLKEGRTIETVVKRSCQGRIPVCKAIIKLLDDGWIFPYPSSELALLASEHRTHKRFADALNIYRRLMEVTQDESERAELQTMLDETVEDLERAAETGESTEGIDVVSHKDAAEKFKRSQFRRRIALGVFAVAGLVVSSVLLAERFRPPDHLPEDYQVAIRGSDAALDKGKFEEAIDIWDEFYKRMPDKESDVAKRLQDRVAQLRRRFSDFQNTQIQSWESVEKEGKLDEAETGYKTLLEKYPGGAFAARIKQSLERVRKTRDARLEQNTLAQLQSGLREARDAMQKKQYRAARAKFKELAESATKDWENRAEVDESLQKLQAMEDRSKNAMKSAEAELQAKHAEKAIVLFDAAFSEWPELSTAEEARQQSVRLKKSQRDLLELLKDASAAETDNRVFDAIGLLRQAQQEFGEFETTAALGARINNLEAKTGDLNKALSDAQAALKKGDKATARKLLTTLLQRQPGFLAGRGIELPVYVTTAPLGATVTLDGKDMGKTPIDIMLPAEKSVLLRITSDGYEPLEKNLTGISMHDLEINEHLKRAPLHSIDLGAGRVAPLTFIGGNLYVLRGPSLFSINPTSGQKSSIVEKLFDENDVPADLNGTASPGCPPFQGAPGKLMVAARSKSILEIGTDKTVKKIANALSEPMGIALFDRSSSADGIVTVAGIDGKVRAFRVDKPSRPIWEHPLDPNSNPPSGGLAAGMAIHGNGQVVALSVSGQLSGFSLVDGEQRSIIDLHDTMSGHNSFAADPLESLAAFIHATGKVTIVNLDTREKSWELPVDQALDGAVGTLVSTSGIYVVTREGQIRKYPRKPDTDKPAPVWQKLLDGSTEIDLCLSKALYIACNSGHIYAIAPNDGHVLWDFRCGGVPVQMLANGNYVYLALADGRLLILTAE